MALSTTPPLALAKKPATAYAIIPFPVPRVTLVPGSSYVTQRSHKPIMPDCDLIVFGAYLKRDWVRVRSRPTRNLRLALMARPPIDRRECAGRRAYLGHWPQVASLPRCSIEAKTSDPRTMTLANKAIGDPTEAAEPDRAAAQPRPMSKQPHIRAADTCPSFNSTMNFQTLNLPRFSILHTPLVLRDYRCKHWA
jgi:hypothetical protein